MMVTFDVGDGDDDDGRGPDASESDTLCRQGVATGGVVPADLIPRVPTLPSLLLPRPINCVFTNHERREYEDRN